MILTLKSDSKVTLETKPPLSKSLYLKSMYTCYIRITYN